MRCFNTLAAIRRFAASFHLRSSVVICGVVCLLQLSLAYDAYPHPIQPRYEFGSSRNRTSVRDQSEIAAKAMQAADQLRLDGKEESLRSALDQYELAARALK